jgi:hypothetical protein
LETEIEVNNLKIPRTLDYDFYKEWLHQEKFDTKKSFLISVGRHPENFFEGLKVTEQMNVILPKVVELMLVEPIGSNVQIKDTSINPIKMVEIAFQYEVNFPHELAKAYKDVIGADLKYEDYSPVYQLYDEWCLRPLVTLQQGICLIHGMNPEVFYKSYYAEMLSENPLFPIDTEQYKKSYDLAISCIRADTLKPNKCFNINHPEKSEFELIAFIKWAKKFKRNPHPLLLKFLGHKEIISNNPITTNNSGELKISKQQFLDEMSYFTNKERISELHVLFASVYIDLLVSSKALPKSSDVWSEISKRYKEDNSNISPVKSIDRNCIIWQSSTSEMKQSFKKGSLNNLITEIRQSAIEKLSGFIA